MFSLEAPHRGDSNECTQYTVFENEKNKITLNYPKPSAMGFFEVTQELVRNSRGKRAISVRATEGLLYQTNENCAKYLNVAVCTGEHVMNVRSMPKNRIGATVYSSLQSDMHMP